MKSYVLNINKHRRAFGLIKITSFILVIAFLYVLFFDLLTESRAFISAMARENGKNIVIIDAGHGGEDPGAIGNNGVYEKDLNLSIAVMIGEILSDNGFAVTYTRLEDKLLYTAEENIKGIRKISDLKNRCKIAAEYPNSIFLSIHMNSYGNSKYSGLQAYYSQNNDGAKLLAESIQSTVKEEVQNENNRSIKSGKDIYILEHTKNVSVLIECGFLTNPEECQKLSEKEYQKRLSLAIVCGIIRYMERQA